MKRKILLFFVIVVFVTSCDFINEKTQWFSNDVDTLLSYKISKEIFNVKIELATKTKLEKLKNGKIDKLGRGTISLFFYLTI